MKNEYMSLNKIIDIPKWQYLQDALATATGMAIITVDYKGVPVTTHSSCQAFCRSVRGDKALNKNCEKCDSRAGLEAVRQNKPYIYLCHYDIIDAAIPIIVDDKYLGAVMVGQVILTMPEDAELERICTPLRSEDALHTRKMLQSKYDQLPKLPLERVKVIVEMLFHLCNYIVDEAIEKKMTLEIYENILYNRDSLSVLENISGYPVNVMEKVKKKITRDIANTKIIGEPPEPGLMNTTLGPALTYIHSGVNNDYSLKKMAELCHISPSYFSRLFSKEIGEPFSSYIARLKIQNAKELLATTDIPITQISEILDFSDDGYFIKLFKKYEGLTPLAYRKFVKK